MHETFHDLGIISNKSSQFFLFSLEALKMVNDVQWKQLKYFLNLEWVDHYSIFINDEIEKSPRYNIKYALVRI
jgi:hypothetical protein